MQRFHGDTAEVLSLKEMAVGDMPYSAMTPMSVGGTTIIVIPFDASGPRQVFIPIEYLMVWRGDLEHCGDEWLRYRNIALFAYVLPPTNLYAVPKAPDGAGLLFFAPQLHTRTVLHPSKRGPAGIADEDTPATGSSSEAAPEQIEVISDTESEPATGSSSEAAPEQIEVISDTESEQGAQPAMAPATQQPAAGAPTVVDNNGRLVSAGARRPGVSRTRQRGLANGTVPSAAGLANLVQKERLQAPAAQLAPATQPAPTGGAPILKVCGKAEHPTLGIVTILQLGTLGCKIEFWSARDATLKERQILRSDLVPLPDEYELSADNSGTPDPADDDPLQDTRTPQAMQQPTLNEFTRVRASGTAGYSVMLGSDKEQLAPGIHRYPTVTVTGSTVTVSSEPRYEATRQGRSLGVFSSAGAATDALTADRINANRSLEEPQPSASDQASAYSQNATNTEELPPLPEWFSNDTDERRPQTDCRTNLMQADEVSALMQVPPGVSDAMTSIQAAMDMGLHDDPEFNTVAQIAASAEREAACDRIARQADARLDETLLGEMEGLRLARLAAIGDALQAELVLCVSSKNTTGYKFVKELRYKSNDLQGFKASIQGSMTRPTYSAGPFATPEDAALCVAYRLRDHPCLPRPSPISAHARRSSSSWVSGSSQLGTSSSHRGKAGPSISLCPSSAAQMLANRQAEATAALGAAQAEDLLLVLNGDGSGYRDVQTKPFKGRGEGLPRFQARLTLSGGAGCPPTRVALGVFDTAETAALAIARSTRQAKLDGKVVVAARPQKRKAGLDGRYPHKEGDSSVAGRLQQKCWRKK